MIKETNKKVSKVVKMAVVGNNHFWYLVSKTEIIGIAVLTKTEVKQYTSLKDAKEMEEFIIARVKMDVIHPKTGYWPAQYVQHYENTPSGSRNVILQATTGQKAYSIDCGIINYTDWYKLLILNSDKKTWGITEDRGVTVLRERKPVEIKKFGAILQKSFIHGQATSVLAKVHKGNGRILLKVSSNFSLK